MATLDSTLTLRRFAPQRLLIATARQRNSVANVLFCDDASPFAAELAGRGLVIAHYDPELERAGRAADKDASGDAWRAVFARTRAGFAIVGENSTSAPLHAALADAHLLQQVGTEQLWQLPAQVIADGDLIHDRDAAARQLRP